MVKLEALKPGALVRGIIPERMIRVVSVHRYGEDALELTYKDQGGRVFNQLLFRADEARLSLVEEGRPWLFDGDGALFRLVSEAQRIRLAHLFDPLLAVHTSLVEPLPHQITAVYETMLPRQPLRFLLADDPGAGKTIMAGLLMKELIARGDLQRCLVVCPGNLAEQWQDELYQRFSLPFEILTNDKIEASLTGNWFMEHDLIIARLDMLSRNESLQDKLKAQDCLWDLIVCDEAHKMSATYFGGEITYTKRFQLGRLLSSRTRHFLLLTATPHNGKEADFQLFMSLLDGDRFEGRFRDGVHQTDVSDLMRRMVKEQLLTFEGKPLFPQRVATTVPYHLSDEEAALYAAVTSYVRDEFNRAEALQNEKRASNVGFALTVLQRRLASSPEAIYQSLKRRRERLESRLRELETVQRGAALGPILDVPLPLDAETLDELDDAPDSEVETIEEEVLDQATAARTIAELKTEIATLTHLEARAAIVRRSGQDTKWRELAELLAYIFAPEDHARPPEPEASPRPRTSPHQKLIIFTEHRDTLNYLQARITTLLGQQDAVVVMHGGMGREERLKIQEAFKFQPEVRVLIATDAAGEGINLQRAHLMVNYDLPWNPNRLEQRFGRIHRIGQTETCFLWNLVAEDTREGDVYRTLLTKLEAATKALGGQVFNVLGKLQFDGKSLKDLLIDAIRYGERPEVRDFLNRVVDQALDTENLKNLLEEKALAHDVMDSRRVQTIREDMERAEARRLQPHYIESFFREAFTRLGGTMHSREPRRYEITHVPAVLRQRNRLIGTREPVLSRYERVTFEKDLVNLHGSPLASFICPGNPLLDAVIDLTLEQNRDILTRGTALVDTSDPGTCPRICFYLDHEIKDASRTPSGERRTISRRMLYIELDAQGSCHHLHYAPYLDYRPLEATEPGIEAILARPECAWIQRGLEEQALRYAVQRVVPEHLKEVTNQRLALIEKTRQAVKERLTKEINYWDHRAEELKAQERAGKPNARLNSEEARKRADQLQERLRTRLHQLDLEAQIAPLPPVLVGGFLVIPMGLLRVMSGQPPAAGPAIDTQEAAARARAIVMDIERSLGYEPVDREFEKVGYDIESRIPGTGRLRLIEVKGRISGARTLTVTRNEILYSLNKPDDYILAIVEFFDDGSHNVHYIRRPFQREPDFLVTSVEYDFAGLLARAEEPR
ncbi:MAG: helicase-related protein [Spirochaetaceae bacterium]|nr:helicase-related protein [Spirochaetaceae bacterium]